MPSQRPVRRTRNTWQRDVVKRILETAACHLTAEEVHQRTRRGTQPIGLATVYRALEAFVREGLVEPVYVGDGSNRYGLAAKHHDHLVCLKCGDWEPLRECLLPRVPARISSGFRVTGHQLEVYGYCRDCQGADA